MPQLALVLLVSWLLLVAGLRGYLQARRTGAIPARFKARPGEPQWWARLISTFGIGFAFAAPIADLAGMAPIGFLDQDLVGYIGAALAVVGIAGTLLAQAAMGDSWRPDVDPNARTPLVTSGPFRLVRNPVLSCTAVTVIGLALMVPNVFAALMLAACVISWQVQIRLVEEPYLKRLHGDDYLSYAARTGRFLPGIGRLTGR